MPEDLREKLTSLRITATELAREMAVTARAVRWWLAGERAIPVQKVEIALARLLGQREGYRRGAEEAAEAAGSAIAALPARRGRPRAGIPARVKSK